MYDVTKNDVKIRFNDEDDFRELLVQLHDEDEWLETRICDIQLSSDSTVEGCEDKDVKININGKEYPLNPFGYTSVVRRAGFDGEKPLNKLTGEDFAHSLNLFFDERYQKDDRGNSRRKTAIPKQRCGKALIRGGNTLVLHSGDYTPVAQLAIYDEFAMYLFSNFSDVEFVDAVYEHTITQAAYQIKDEELFETYIEELRSAGYHVEEDDIKFSVGLNTSDTGMSSIYVRPYLSLANGVTAQVGIPNKQEHRGKKKASKSNSENLEEIFSKIFPLIKESLENLNRLLKFDVKYPASCAFNVAKKIKVSTTAFDKIKHHFEAYEAVNEPMNAHQFYYTMCELIPQAEADNQKNTTLIALKEQLATILTFSDKEWAEVDKKSANVL